jgi:hypothetical protein
VLLINVDSVIKCNGRGAIIFRMQEQKLSGELATHQTIITGL